MSVLDLIVDSASTLVLSAVSIWTHVRIKIAKETGVIHEYSSYCSAFAVNAGKEKEVLAMENGGNSKTNAIFEARLAQSGRPKPTNLADGPTRERFIRDKYERRKFYDPAGYALAGNSGGGVPRAPHSGPGSDTARPGAPSDVARQRVAQRQARMKPSHSQVGAPATNARPKVAQSPVSAPVVMDLLDFAAPSAPATAAADPFAASAPTQAPPDPFAPQATQQQHQAPPTLAPPPTQQQQAQPKAPAPTPGQEFLSLAPAAPAPAPATSTASIMALFNTPPQQQSFGMMGMPNNNMNGGMMPQQMGGMMAMNNVMMNANNMQQQQMMMQNTNPQMNPQMMAMMNNNMQMNNMQQQMMMQQQNQPQMNNMMGGGNQMGGAMNNSGMTNNNISAMNNNMQSMMQGMQQMNMGHQQQSNDNGFGAPMGGKSPSMKDDPFSTLGGINAFR